MEDTAEGIRVAHAHDEGVETHGAGGKHKEGIADAVVVASPAIAYLVGRLAMEVAGLASLEGRDHQHGGALNIALVEFADGALYGCKLFRGHGYIVFRGLGIGPRGGFLRKGEELAYLGFADGLGGIVATDAATGGDYIVKAGAIGCSAGGLASARAEQEAEQKAKERGLFHNNGV